MIVIGMIFLSNKIFIGVTIFQIQKSLNMKSKIAMMNNLTIARSLSKNQIRSIPQVNGPRHNSVSRMMTETYMSFECQMMSILKE